MRKITYAITLIFILCFITACSLNHKENALEEMSYRAAGYDRSNSLFQTNSPPSPNPIRDLEQRVEHVPGVSNVSVLFYPTDNLIVGFSSDNTPSYAVTEARVRQELQGEAKHYLVYLVNEQNPDLLARVWETRFQQRQGKTVSDSEMLSIMNGVWKAIVPFNFLSKT